MLAQLSEKKILITGGLGFIGSNLADKCLHLGAKVTVYDNLDPRLGGNLQNISSFKKDIELIQKDIRDADALTEAVKGQDIIFNCAAYTSHAGSMREPLEVIDINCKGTINLLEAARKVNVDAKIIHVGTSTQVGKMQLNVVDELHPEYPIDIYSANKTVSEKYVLIYNSAYKMRTSVVRLANNYGPRATIKSPDFGFINFFVGLALQNKEITVFGEGGQLRSFSYVEDSVEALIAVALSEKSNGQVFFAVSDEQVSVHQVSEKIVKIIGGKLKQIDWPNERKVIEIGDAVISNKKIKEVLGWKPECTVEEGLKKTKEYFTPVLEKYL